MNFLAHLYLARDDDELMVGQMLGDFLEPGWRERCPVRVQLGVRAHQRIDAFTDSHPVFQRSRARFQAPYRRYAGVLVDVFYDHFLARRWEEFSPEESLPDFSARCYRTLERHEAVLTDRFRRVLPLMVEHDWLGAYRHREGIGRALRGISRRLRRENPLAEAISLIDELDGELDRDFVELFPELESFVAQADLS